MWEKIVLNLISNAFKFTLEGEITVALRPTGDQVELTVQDTGTGIPEPELPLIFDRFHRIEGAQTRTHEGTGIGLSLVNELVKLHGGTIQVSSAMGGGSTFRVAIPCGTAHLAPDRIRAVSAPAASTVRASAFVEEALRWLPESSAGKPPGDGDDDGALGRTDADPIEKVQGCPRVVLADDNADMRGYIKRILEGAGYAVCTVED